MNLLTMEHITKAYTDRYIVAQNLQRNNAKNLSD